VVPSESSFRPGNREDFDRLYDESYSRILKTMVAIVGDQAAAEDCTQDAFVRAFKAWHRWQPVSSPEAWLQRIAVRVAISHRRHERLRSIGETIRRLGAPGHVRGHDDAVSNADALMAALRSLPPHQSAAVVLRYHHGYTSREIATALGVPESTVASRLAKARAALSFALEEQSTAPSTVVAGAESR
jgi:RNA polymerase sigma-70 factor (ECF subfamily)